MTGKKKDPPLPDAFTRKEIMSLWDYQHSGFHHPFTCGNRGDGNHPESAVLIPTRRGWMCPFCPYTQNWAHDFMKDGSWDVGQPKFGSSDQRPDGICGPLEEGYCQVCGVHECLEHTHS